MRPTIVVALTLALFLGQTVVAVERAACAIYRDGKPPTCARCAGQGTLPAASFVADRTCCQVQGAPADREPARMASERSLETRLPMVAILQVPALLASSAAPRSVPAFETPPPDPLPRFLRTTILLI